jgi:hypothetical protein
MTAFELMKLREGSSGGTVRGDRTVSARYIYDQLLPDDPSYKLGVEIMNKGTMNLRMDTYKMVYGTTPQMDIHASLSSEIMFNLGDVFSYDNGFWLCVDARTEHDIMREGKIEECNYLLKWQNPKTYEIIERWCSVRDPYSSGLDEGRVVTTGNAKYEIKLPHDAETELFHVTKRFLISIANHEPMAYEIIKYDAVTNRYESRNEGFLRIVLIESRLFPDDNWDLMVANYKDPNVSPAPVGSCKIVYTGDAILKSGSSARTYAAMFYDSEGAQIALTPDWSLVLPPEIAEEQITREVNGQSITLKALSGTRAGSTVTLKMTAEDATYGNFEAEVDIEIQSVY